MRKFLPVLMLVVIPTVCHAFAGGMLRFGSSYVAGGSGDHGSIVQSAGVYTHTFTSDVTITVSYLKAGGGGGTGGSDADVGGFSYLRLGVITRATAVGGEGAYGDGSTPAPGGATNNIGGTNNAGGGAAGGWGPTYSGAAGGSMTGGSLTATSGQILTVIVGGGGTGWDGGSDGSPGSVSLSW
jgi:hypothetical protein